MILEVCVGLVGHFLHQSWKKKPDQSLQSELRERKQKGCPNGISPIAIKGYPKGYIMEKIMTKMEKFFSVKLIKC